MTFTQTNVIWVIKSKRMGWARYVARMGKNRGTSRILVRKPEGKGPLGKTSHRWEDNLAMDKRNRMFGR
jgi:hypothetical protein